LERMEYYNSLKYKWDKAPLAAGPDTPKVAKSPLPNVDLSGFVTAVGTNFVVGGKVFYFTGSNAYYLTNVDVMSEKDIDTFYAVSTLIDLGEASETHPVIQHDRLGSAVLHNHCHMAPIHLCLTDHAITQKNFSSNQPRWLG
jgi:hypothetical protein